MGLCFCGKETLENNIYCEECFNKREEFIATVVNDYNAIDTTSFEYIVTSASEVLRVREMSTSIGELVDQFYLNNSGELDPYLDNSFLERIYTLKVDMLERFIDLLGTRDRDLSLSDMLESYYKIYEDRINDDIRLTKSYINELREGIVNPNKKILTTAN